MTDTLISLEETSHLARQSISPLARWRCEGAGPAWHKLGRKVYCDRADVEDWVGKPDQLRLKTDPFSEAADQFIEWAIAKPRKKAR
jgi:hypothetical protein